MGTITIHSEEQLVQLLKQGTREAFDYLYQQYSGALYGVILKVVIDEEISRDVLQEAFVKIWNAMGSYDAQKGRLYTWMLNIARNAAIDKLRSKGEIMRDKIHSTEDNVDYMERSSVAQPKTDTIGVAKMVATLKPEQEVVIRMAYYEGYTTDEIAKELAIPQGTVKTRMRAAIKQLRSYF